jgi:conjugal transfer mating pair stabilization protein TraN
VSSYSCSAGYTLSGSTCTKTNYSSAAISYSCPAGSTLTGSSCITVVTTPAKINYSCLDGSAPINGACIYKSAKTEWINACGAFESASGTLLGAP